MSTPLKIIFAGTPVFAAQHLEALINSGHDIIATYTQPDRKSGRGKKLKHSPVKDVATAHDIPVYQPENFKSQDQLDTLISLNADLMIVVAYGIILPLCVLETPKKGCINVHASLLPRWRGAAPIERSLLAGDPSTGITIMQMDQGLDTGDMLIKQTLPIPEDINSGELHDALIPVGISALESCLALIKADNLNPIPQDSSLANYAEKLTKAEGNIDWEQSAESIDRKIRGLTPRPIAFSHLGQNVVRIWKAEISQINPIPTSPASPGEIIDMTKQGIVIACGFNSFLLIKSAQLPNGKQLSSVDLFNSKRDFFVIGEQFSPNCLEKAST